MTSDKKLERILKKLRKQLAKIGYKEIIMDIPPDTIEITRGEYKLVYCDETLNGQTMGSATITQNGSFRQHLTTIAGLNTDELENILEHFIEQQDTRQA